jgi:uncharacterized protein YukE
MRALAAAVRGWAGVVGDESGRAAAAVGAMPFEGPAAERLRQAASDWRAASQGVAHALDELANELLRAAAQVELEQRLLEQRLREEQK